jgi:hypothetical protein
MLQRTIFMRSMLQGRYRGKIPAVRQMVSIGAVFYAVAMTNAARA